MGDDIYIAASPGEYYRSLKKGIVSSIKNRFSHTGAPVWEVSGGVIYGSSGGGAFTEYGKLFGVLISMAAMNIMCDENDYCQDEVPLSHIAFISRPHDIKDFLLKGKYNKYFKYLE